MVFVLNSFNTYNIPTPVDYETDTHDPLVREAYKRFKRQYASPIQLR